MSQSVGRHLTVPKLCRKLGLSRSQLERILWQFRDRLPEAQRVGIIRVYPPKILGLVNTILEEEARVNDRSA